MTTLDMTLHAKQKHLIVGAGNMGKRYSEILRRLGEKITLVDVGFDPKLANSAKSILLCTPPETHAELIKMFGYANPNTPLFCEKPVIVKYGELEGALQPKVSMVSCNWRWCDCYEVFNDFSCGYAAGEYGRLDLIHFLDLFWERYGQPEYSSVVDVPGYKQLSVAVRNHGRRQSIIASIWTEASPFCEINGKTIFAHKCDMHKKQMRCWLKVVSGREKSPNPISRAVVRTEWLIKTFKGSPQVFGTEASALLA